MVRSLVSVSSATFCSAEPLHSMEGHRLRGRCGTYGWRSAALALHEAGHAKLRLVGGEEGDANSDSPFVAPARCAMVFCRGCW